MYEDLIIIKKGLQSGSITFKGNAYKSDVFNLGISLLHAVLLTSMDGLYNLRDYTFREQELDKRIKELEASFYS